VNRPCATTTFSWFLPVNRWLDGRPSALVKLLLRTIAVLPAGKAVDSELPANVDVCKPAAMPDFSGSIDSNGPRRRRFHEKDVVADRSKRNMNGVRSPIGGPGNFLFRQRRSSRLKGTPPLAAIAFIRIAPISLRLTTAMPWGEPPGRLFPHGRRYRRSCRPTTSALVLPVCGRIHCPKLIEHPVVPKPVRGLQRDLFLNHSVFDAVFAAGARTLVVVPPAAKSSLEPLSPRDSVR